MKHNPNPKDSTLSQTNQLFFFFLQGEAYHHIIVYLKPKNLILIFDL